MALETPVKTCLCGRYTLLEKVGAGGAGEVWLARDDERGTEVALKILDGVRAHDPAAWRFLQHEFSVANRLNHPFVLKVYPPERDGEAIFLPMEYAPGGDAERLRRSSYLEIVPVLIEVAQALAHLHARGFVHGDVKAQNVLFGSDRHVRLADFGVASQMLPQAPDSSNKPTGFSPLTASPEQLRGAPRSVADDVYGLGALACELLTGRAPYYCEIDRAGALDDPARGLGEPVPRIEPVHPAPDRLIALVADMLETQALHRPRGMPEVIERLESSLSDTLTFDAPPAPSQPASDGESARTGPSSSVEPSAPAERAASAARALEAEPQDGRGIGRPAPQDAQARRSDPAAPRAEISRTETLGAEAVRSTESPRALATASTGPSGHGPATMRTDPDWRGLDRDLRGLSPALHARPRIGYPRPRERRHLRWFWAIAAIAAASVAGVLLLPHGPTRVRSWVSTALAPLQPVDSRHTVAKAARETDAVAESQGVPTGPGRESAAPGKTPARGARAAANEAAFTKARSRLDARLNTLDKRGAPAWGGKTYAEVKTLEAEAVGANEAGNAALALEKLKDAETGLASIERVEPSMPPTRRRPNSHNDVLRTLVEGLNAEVQHNDQLAARDFGHVLALDPHNAVALAGLQRARNPLDVGVAGAAQAPPQRAGDTLQPLGSGTRPTARAPAALVSAAPASPAATPPVPIHISVKAALTRRMRALVNQPSDLDSRPIRREAAALVREERATPDPGAALQALATELSSLVAAYGKTVHVALVSDDQTQVEITQIGSLGTFVRRNLDLRPGVYTVVGTRSGYKTVRREVTVRPGAGVQLIRVRCDEPI